MKTTSTHDMVKESYKDMLNAAQENQSCCTSSPAARLAGYEDAERHGEAASASFGCGNPLAFTGVKEDDVVLDLGSGAGTCKVCDCVCTHAFDVVNDSNWNWAQTGIVKRSR